jgi:plastocyanin
MYTRRRAVLLVGGLAILAVAGLLTVLQTGLSADRAPGRVETLVARNLVRLSIPTHEASRNNPLNGSGAWQQGAELFRRHCSLCHGANGRGATAIGPRMNPPVPDLASHDVQRFSDGALFAIVSHGVSWTGMPAFAGVLGESDRWKLVSFVRRTPTLTAAELLPRDQSKASARIVMDGTSFRPAEATVHTGEPVLWANLDPFPHNVTSASGNFHSGDLAPDGTWVFRPTERGTFEYHCTLHPGMKAVLRVR